MLSSLIESLSKPSAYPHKPEKVELIQTHISYILLAGDLAYKVKKPLDLGFLDFTTLESRKRFCEEEVRLNRRLAPDIYLGVVNIVRKGADYAVESAGNAVEYAVKMMRMDQNRMMDVMLEHDMVTREHINAIIEKLVPFYENAESGPHIDVYGETEKIKFNTDENFRTTVDLVGTAFTAERYGDIVDYTNTFLQKRFFFRKRIEDGKIRDCHGDLHSANICLSDDVIIYDCIEFNHRFRYGDVAADVAFLAMDLDFRGRADLSNHFAQSMALLSEDERLLEALPFYKCYRAYVRGKIHGIASGQSEQPEADRKKELRLARRYFSLAHRYSGAYHKPKVLVVFGLSGSGKSTLAQKLGREIGWPVINSDRVRKELAGLAPEERRREGFGEGLYSRAMTEKTYRTMIERAEEFLAEGQSVLLDATFSSSVERLQAISMAQRVDAELHFLLCQCPEAVILDRLRTRESQPGAVSDADTKVYSKQKEVFDFSGLDDLDNLLPVDTSAPSDWVAHDLADRFLH